MLANGKNLNYEIATLIDKERELAKKMEELSEKFESAENVGDSYEMERIGQEGMKLNNQIMSLMIHKQTLMMMATSKNPNFCYN